MKSRLQPKLLIPLFLLSVVFGCGENRPGTSTPGIGVQPSNIAEYVLLQQGSLVATAEGLSGSGTVIFKESRKDEDNRYTLSFSLQDKGSLTLHSNANSKLQNGVTFTYKRDGDILQVILKRGAEEYDVSTDFSEIKASEQLEFFVEIHGHGHVITEIKGQEAEYAFSQIQGQYNWGLSLENATVTKAEAGKATEEH